MSVALVTEVGEVPHDRAADHEVVPAGDVVGDGVVNETIARA